MIRADFRQLSLTSLLIGFLSAPMVIAVQGPTDPQRLAEGSGETAMSVDNMLQRIDKYRSLGRDSAELMRQGLRESASPVMELELGLLEAFAIDPVGDPDQARGRIARQLEPGGPELPGAVRSLLEFILVELEGRGNCLRHQTHLEGQLILEREAHAETREKLEALRRVDQELEGRENDTTEHPSR